MRTLDGTTQGGATGTHAHQHVHSPDTFVDWSSYITGSWALVTTWQDLVGATATIGPGLAYFYVIGYYFISLAAFDWRIAFTSGGLTEYYPDATGQTTSDRSFASRYEQTDTLRFRRVLSTTETMQVQIRVPAASSLSISDGLVFGTYYIEVPSLPEITI